MAIQKPYAINGVSGNFWVTSGIYISPDYSHARSYMKLYTNQTAYVSGAHAVYGIDSLLVNAPFSVKGLAPISEADQIRVDPILMGGTFVSGF